MRKEFLLNISFLVLINLLIKPFYVFGVEAKVQNAVGPEAYGVYFSLFNFALIFQIVSDLGIHSFNLRHLSQNRSKIRELVSSVVPIKIILGFVFLIIVILFSFAVGYPSQLYPILLFIVLNQALQSFNLYFRSNLSASGRYRLDSVISVVDKFILIVTLLFLLHRFPNQFSIEWFVYAQTIAFGVVFLIGLVCVFQMTGPVSLNFSVESIVKYLKKSLPYALIIFLMTVFTKMDGVMLERMLNDQGLEAGIYAAAFRVFDAGNMFSYLFAGLLLPMFAYQISRNESFTSLLETGFKLLFVGPMILAMACITFKNEIMNFLYPDHATEYYGLILVYLMIAFVSLSIAYAFGSLISANGKLSGLNKMLAVGVLINLLLNILLIPKMGAEGAAIATLLTQFYAFLGQVVISRKLLGVVINGNLILRLMLLTIVVFGIFQLLEGALDLNWMIEVSIGILLSILVSLLLRILEISELSNILLKSRV